MRKQFDCLDFYEWSRGRRYDFREYIVPEGTVYMPDLEDLIEMDAR